MFKLIKNKRAVLAAALMASSFITQATVVEIRTSLGSIEVNLFDNTTPKTVENFLSYVNSGAYANTVFHRSVPGFVIQSGGFKYTGPLSTQAAFELDSVAIGTPVENEPVLSNLRGTIAMAKLGNDPNSATSQWFISLDDNSANLDTQNGGFTVFGQVIGDGMQVVDEIAGLTLYPGGPSGSPFTSFPVRNINVSEFNALPLADRPPLDDNNVVIVSDIVVTDSAVATNTNLNPTRNTLINPPSTGGGSGGNDSGSGGGGAFGWIILVGAFGLVCKRLTKWRVYKN